MANGSSQAFSGKTKGSNFGGLPGLVTDNQGATGSLFNLELQVAGVLTKDRFKDSFVGDIKIKDDFYDFDQHKVQGSLMQRALTIGRNAATAAGKPGPGKDFVIRFRGTQMITINRFNTPNIP